MGGLDDATRPLRYVFDEGHHLFDAADGAFGAHLSGVEASDLRRWILGAEGRRGSRARGLETPPQRPAGRGRRGAERAAPPARSRAVACPRPTGRRGWPTARCWARPRSSWRWCASRCARARPARTRASARNATCGRSIPACSRPPTGWARRSSRCSRRCASCALALRAKLEGEADKLDIGPARHASRAWRARSPTAARSTLEAWRAMLRGLHNDPDPGLRRLVRHRAHPAAARSMSACTATISIRPSRS